MHYKNKDCQFRQQTTFHPSFISTNMNPTLQQQICDELTSAFEQAKTDILNLCVKTAEIQMQTYDKEYNKQLDKIFIERKQANLPSEHKLTGTMLRLLEKRADNRNERIKCVNQYKIHCIHRTSNHS